MLHLYFTKRREGVVARALCTAWRPTIRRKRIGLLTSSFALAHRNPWAPGSSLCLYSKFPASCGDARALHEVHPLAQ